MELKTCEYCGTEYSSDQPQCPLCGRSNVSAAGEKGTKPKRRVSSSGGARVAPKGGSRKKSEPESGDRIPKGFWVAACCILGVAVLIGAIYFVYVMGFFSGGVDLDEIPQKQEEQMQPEQKPEPAPEPEVLPEQKPQPEPDSKACTGLTISQTSVVLDEAGSRMFLTAVARPTDCKDPISYTSSDEKVVAVTKEGMITAIGPGTAEILVSCGTIQEVCTVQCVFELESETEQNPDEEKEPGKEEPKPEEPKPEEPKPEDQKPEQQAKPELSSVDFTLFYPGEETVLSVKDAPSGAAISYVSSDSRVVTVTNGGKVTAVGNGTATITVTVGETKLTCIARCNLGSSTENGSTAKPEDYAGPFTLSHTDVTLAYAGEKFQLVLTDSTGKTVTGLSWSSGNGGVCAVSGSTVQAVGKGTTNVTATFNGVTYTCIIRCNF